MTNSAPATVQSPPERTAGVSASDEAEIANVPIPRENRGTVSTPDKASASSLPLTRGVYVLTDDRCDQPANASFRVWNGEGLSGSSTRACRTTVKSRDGTSFRVSNDCENTYDGKRTAEVTTIRVPSATTFVQKAQTFRLCPIGEVPNSLRQLVG